MLAATVSWKSAISWLTMEICRRRDASVASRRSTPSSRTAPASGSKNRGTRLTRVDFPPRKDDERERLARRDDEGHVPESGRPVVAVAEDHGIEFDSSFGPAELDGTPVRLLRLVEEPEHALRRGQPLLNLRVEPSRAAVSAEAAASPPP